MQGCANCGGHHRLRHCYYPHNDEVIDLNHQLKDSVKGEYVSLTLTRSFESFTLITDVTHCDFGVNLNACTGKMHDPGPQPGQFILFCYHTQSKSKHVVSNMLDQFRRESTTRAACNRRRWASQANETVRRGASKQRAHSPSDLIQRAH